MDCDVSKSMLSKKVKSIKHSNCNANFGSFHNIEVKNLKKGEVFHWRGACQLLVFV